VKTISENNIVNTLKIYNLLSAVLHISNIDGDTEHLSFSCRVCRCKL